MTWRLPAIAASGWLLVAILAWTIRLPYRRGRRLRLHYWLGYAIAAMATVHGMAAMTRGIAGRAHALSLQLASLALLVALCEVGVGLWLRQRPERRAEVRRVHFWIMVLLVGLVAVHVAMDSWLLGTFHPADLARSATHAEKLRHKMAR